MSSVVLQHIEFVKLRKYLVLAIVVSTTGSIHNQVVEMEENFSQSELDHLSDYLNSFLTGLTLSQVREKLLEQMRVAKNTYDRLLEQALKLGEKAFSSIDETDVFIEGKTNILNEPEFNNISRMTDLFRTFEEKATMLKLLDAGQIWGALGVIGPRRMNYSKVIPLVGYSARLLTEILERHFH
jgi:heat-inducible transcriptional repressor